MIGFNHALAGGVIALTVQDPLLVAPLALASHFALDALPHFGQSDKIKPYNKSFKQMLVFDAIVCFTVLGLLLWRAPELWPAILVGTFFATLPDFIWLLRGEAKWLSWFFKFHSKIQQGERPWGWRLEIIYFISLSTLAVLTSS